MPNTPKSWRERRAIRLRKREVKKCRTRNWRWCRPLLFSQIDTDLEGMAGGATNEEEEDGDNLVPWEARALGQTTEGKRKVRMSVLIAKKQDTGGTNALSHPDQSEDARDREEEEAHLSVHGLPTSKSSGRMGMNNDGRRQPSSRQQHVLRAG